VAIILICSVLFQKGVNNMYNPLKDITEEDKHIGAENREMRAERIENEVYDRQEASQLFRDESPHHLFK